MVKDPRIVRPVSPSDCLPVSGSEISFIMMALTVAWSTFLQFSKEIFLIDFIFVFMSVYLIPLMLKHDKIKITDDK